MRALMFWFYSIPFLCLPEGECVAENVNGDLGVTTAGGLNLEILLGGRTTCSLASSKDMMFGSLTDSCADR
jgi:hypothetical protein